MLFDSHAHLDDGRFDNDREEVIQHAYDSGIERIINEEKSYYQVGINSDFLKTFLVNIASELKLNPKDARYIFNDETRELEVIESAIIGRELNIDESIKLIQETILTENSHEIPLVFDINKPFLTNEVKGAAGTHSPDIEQAQEK